jgi:hypothetical protein
MFNRKFRILKKETYSFIQHLHPRPSNGPGSVLGPGSTQVWVRDKEKAVTSQETESCVEEIHRQLVKAQAQPGRESDREILVVVQGSVTFPW